MFVSVNGGLNKALKNQQSLVVWTQNSNDHNLDIVFVFTHAPGSSAHNPVERRMAPLSKDTVGFILPFDTFDNHLDRGNKIVDLVLEMTNMKYGWYFKSWLKYGQYQLLTVIQI